MKVRASVKVNHPDSKMVRRRGVLYVINKTDPSKKMRQKGPARKKAPRMMKKINKDI